MDLEEFRNPRKQYRPSPFWSWNDRLESDELRWQVREFADKGFGGYFMHSRVGLRTPYLSEEWMRRVRDCLEEGTKADLESWLYDEDKWPSGFAGGKVLAKNQEYRARTLAMREIKRAEVDSTLEDPSVLAVFELKIDPPNVASKIQRIKKSDEIGEDGSVYALKVEMNPRNNWFNGEPSVSYVDLLNPKVTEEFLAVTIDAYAREFQASFGEHMPGIFTDEPTCFSPPSAKPPFLSITWTGEMPGYFYQRNGYDLMDKLPLLFFEGEGCRKVRYDFWRTTAQRFIEAWTIPYSQRCERYGLMMTGHYLLEDNLVTQTAFIGAAMPHYEYMQLPGIDHLGRNVLDPLTLKQCSSVAHQFRRARVISELFGCSGHSMTFEDQKWIADFHFALGITFLCQHLTLYTQMGDGKRDFPPTISYHQTYWPHYKLINDYFSRASYLCSQGQFGADILVLHPIASTWATYSPKVVMDLNSEPWRYNGALVKLMDDLLTSHWAFDFGDETILDRHAWISGTGSISVSEMTYRLIIVPPSLAWSSRTVSLMTKFLKVGGRILFVGEEPRLIEGEPAEEEWREVLTHPNVVHASDDRGSINDSIGQILTRSVSISDEEGNEIGDIYVHHRVDGNHHIYFLSNKSRTKAYDATVTLAARGEVKELNLFDGSVSKVEAVSEADRTVVKAVFPPAGSRSYLMDISGPSPPEGSISIADARGEEKIAKLPSVWRFERLHPNSMVLDTCQYSVNGGEWSEMMPVWKIRRDVWKAAGLEPYAGIQPWALDEKGIKPSRTFVLRLRTKFGSEVRSKEVNLVLEKAPLWSLQVNGKPVPTHTDAWHWDKQFGKIDISENVKVGENVIELSCPYGLDVPIEDIYLVGEFGVKRVSETEYVLSNEPETLRNGDWVEQGYPFYVGTMRYKVKHKVRMNAGERLLVRLPSAAGTLFLVHVNGRGSVPICWNPLEADITELAREGENDLAIDVVSSLRNTFGPLHHKMGDDLGFVGPGSFVDEKNWVDAYQFARYGLLVGAEIVKRTRS